MRTLDRLVIAAYARSFLISLSSLLSLYIVIDMFTNLDAFFQSQGFVQGMYGMARYYMYQSSQIFDRMCEPILLLSGTFTVAWMQRNNELLPLLSAGVPTRRVLRPVFIGAAIFTGVGVANQELIIPRIADMLVRNRDDMDGKRELVAQPSYDSNGIHVEGSTARRVDRSVTFFNCTIPDAQGNGLVHLAAKEAHYVPPGDGQFTGGWLLGDTVPAEIQDWNNPKLARMVSPGRWFVYTRDIDFEMVARNGTWYMLFSTARINQLLHRSDTRRMESMAVLFHMRLTRPIIALLLVVMGLGVILRDPHRHVFISAGWCLVICSMFFALVFASKYLGDHEIFPPALAAWLPVLIFGPSAFIMFDAIYT